MKAAERNVFSLLIVMLIGSSANTYGQEVPADAWSAGREGLSNFIWIVGMDPKMVPKYPDGTIVPNVEESYLGTPYKPLMITDEAILHCAGPSDILKVTSEDGYVFPILNEGSIIAFITVRFLYVPEEGVERWYWGEMRPPSEDECKYYIFLKEFPSEEGYAVFVISWEHPLDRFFMIKTPGGALRVYSGSKFIADLLGMTEAEAKSGMPADANELLARLKGISAEHFTTKQRLQKESKEWQQQMKDSLEKENGQ